MHRAQMNTRIDPKLKLMGDEVLHRYGYSPSSAVQALWTYLAESNELPSFMPPKDDPRRKASKISSLENDEGMAYSAFEELTGIKLKHESSFGFSDDRLREIEWQERGELYA